MAPRTASSRSTISSEMTTAFVPGRLAIASDTAGLLWSPDSLLVVTPTVLLFGWPGAWLAYGLAWAIFPLLLLPSTDAEIAGGIAIVRLAAVIVVLSVGALLSSPIPAAAVAATLPIALCMAAVHIIDPRIGRPEIGLAAFIG